MLSVREVGLEQGQGLPFWGPKTFVELVTWGILYGQTYNSPPGLAREVNHFHISFALPEIHVYTFQIEL